MSSRTTLVVAPMAEEVAEIEARLADREPVEGEGGGAVRGRLAGRDVVVGWTGDGTRRAGEGLRRLIEAWAPERVLVVGIAGALSDDLEVGDVVAAGELLTDGDPGEGGERPPAPAADWLASVGDRLRRGTALSIGRIAVSAEEKARLQATVPPGAPATVDVESAAYARAAAAAGVPFLVPRAVSDRRDEDLPLDFNRFRDDGGGVDRGRVARHLVLRPRSIPAMLDLRRRVELCAVALAEAATAAVEA